MTEVTPFAANARVEGAVAVLTVEGEVDIATAPELSARLAEAAAAGARDIVIDASRIRFLDSSGVAALVDSVKQLQPAGGSLTVRSARPQLRRVLEITGLTELITLD